MKCPQCGRPNMEPLLTSFKYRCWWCSHEVGAMAQLIASAEALNRVFTKAVPLTDFKYRDTRLPGKQMRKKD